MKYTLYILSNLLLFLNHGCHSKNGLGLNAEASIHHLGDLPENPLLLYALTTFIHPKDGTMSVLYGNKQVYDYASTDGEGNYPPDAVLYDVTWQSQADEQWFGANVAKVIKTVEQLKFAGNNQPIYTLFAKDLHKMDTPYNIQERINLIIGKKIAVSP